MTLSLEQEGRRVHVFRVEAQRAHRYFVWTGHRRMWLRMPKRRLVWCRNCKKRRWAQNLGVRAYFDQHVFFCLPGKGCGR